MRAFYRCLERLRALTQSLCVIKIPHGLILRIIHECPDSRVSVLLAGFSSKGLSMMIIQVHQHLSSATSLNVSSPTHYSVTMSS